MRTHAIGSGTKQFYIACIRKTLSDPAFDEHYVETLHGVLEDRRVRAQQRAKRPTIHRIVLGTSSALWLGDHRQWVSAVRRWKQRKEGAR